MEKPQVSRHWKEIHLRKDSTESLNDSIRSHHSSQSQGYSRFHFNRVDESKKNSAFQFHSRSRENLHNITTVSNKHSQDELKPRENYAIPKINQMDRMVRRIDNLVEDKGKIPGLSSVVKEIKFVISCLRMLVDHINRQVKEMQFEWDLSLKSLAHRQMNFHDNEMERLRALLQEKEQKIERLNQESVFSSKHIFTLKTASKQGSTIQAPLNSLAVSEAETRPILTSLSRTSTFKSLLGAESCTSPTLNSEKSKKELNSIRQTMSRMKKTLGK